MLTCGEVRRILPYLAKMGRSYLLRAEWSGDYGIEDHMSMKDMEYL